MVLLTNRSNDDILTCLEQYGFVEDRDYHVRNVPHMVNNFKYIKKYLLTKKHSSLVLCELRIVMNIQITTIVRTSYRTFTMNTWTSTMLNC